MECRSELKEQIQFMGYTVTDPVLDKCVKMCEDYCLNAETLAEQWFAFSTNHLNNSSPTIEGLLNMERKELKNSAASTPKRSTENRSRLNNSGTPGATYSTGVADNFGTPKSTRAPPRLGSPAQELPQTQLHNNVPFSPQETQNTTMQVSSLNTLNLKVFGYK